MLFTMFMIALPFLVNRAWRLYRLLCFNIQLMYSIYTYIIALIVLSRDIKSKNQESEWANEKQKNE